MKKLNDLKQERARLLEALNAMTELAETEKRSFTEEEQTQFDKDYAKVQEMDTEIEQLEKQLEIQKRMARNNVKTPEQKLEENFDLFKAISTRANGGNLSGAEAEMHQEGVDEWTRSSGGVKPKPGAIVLPSSDFSKRAEIGTTDGAPPIKTTGSDLLSVVPTPNIMNTLGVTFYEGLTGNFPLPRMGQLTASFVGEKAPVGDAGTNLQKNTLTPRRIGATDAFTIELLSQTNPKVQQRIWQEFIDAIFRGVQIDLFDKIAAGAKILSGHEISAATLGAVTWQHILNLEAAIEEQFSGMAYVMSRAQKAKLKAQDKGTDTGKFVWEGKEVNAFPAFATAALAASNGGQANANFDLIYGYFPGAAVGRWGGVEVIVDPYSSKNEGEIEITANGLFDTDIHNQEHFASLRNADA